MIAWWWAGCAEQIDGDAAERWARRHETTLATAETQLARALGHLPSLPGDPFTCRQVEVASLSKGMLASLCHQQEALWHADRHEAEEEYGTRWLNTMLQSFGVVGVELTIASGGAVEWSDHRGLYTLSEFTADPPPPIEGEGRGEGAGGAVRAVNGRRRGDATLGWGTVVVGLASSTPGEVQAEPHPALEWRLERTYRQSTVTARLLLLADGTPDAAFLRQAAGLEPER
ncbi:MAG: hypothetical protein ABMA64_01910 [Myxococcota bacterium]